MSGGNENERDPRVRLVRDKYFSIRPRPLERWLWAQGIPASAERVFWLHWQEGQQRGDWCSEIPLSRVARECSVDVSTVTRAYQLLGRMGCIRRTDPGRDAGNPFQQAIAVTEVRVPRELLGELGRHPNRRARARGAENCQQGPGVAGGSAWESAGAMGARNYQVGQGVAHDQVRTGAGISGDSLRVESAVIAGSVTADAGAGKGALVPNIELTENAEADGRERSGMLDSAPIESPEVAESGAMDGLLGAASEVGESTPASDIDPTKNEGEADRARRGESSGGDSLGTARLDRERTDPFAGLSGRALARALAELTQAMSAVERNGYQEAMRMHRTSMAFDADSRVTEEGRAAVLRVLGSMAVAAAGSSAGDVQVSKSTEAVKYRRRGLSVFELARLKREIQKAGSCGGRPELLREVVWSIEVGALQRFKPLHAMHIALKKIREGVWTRPHRMPPNWMRARGASAGVEPCSAA